MRISGLTVCVSYADYLQNSIDRWLAGLDSLLVVTNPADAATWQLFLKTAHPKLWIYSTNAFYQNGATFNKGAAISEAVERSQWFEDDWCLLFDSDIIPPLDWHQTVEAANPQRGHLYGAIRKMEDGSTNRSDSFELAGYFQLFHASDENAQRKPLLDCKWSHAGGYDSEFQARWPWQKKHRLPFELLHQGPHGRHWWGRFNTGAMDAMLEERAQTHRLAKSERLKA